MRVSVLSCLIVLAICAADDTPIHFCGRQLAKARAFVCYGDEYAEKRSDPVSLMPAKYYPVPQLNEIDWPWTSGIRAATSTWPRNKRQGLVDACCINPCTRDTLLDYCF